jgi:membrane-bound lytic murein transglycosylase D
MMRNVSLFAAAAALMVVGCATPQPAQDPVPLAFSQALPDSLPAEPVQLEMFAADKATASNEPYGVPNDSLIGTMLETARQHYLSATAAAANGDSLRSAVQFEEAISLLDELSVIPDIDSNKDFADLSRAVVEDYELYIARIDSLSPETSISALREKMNQVADLSDTASLGPQRTIVQGTTVPLVMNTMVERNIEFFTGRGRMHMERWIKNSGRYFPLLKKILQQERVPEELVHLCMIESGVNPNARSWARAVGMWQFVKGTGRLYGLRASYFLDERRDFEKATRAAARHMRDLYEEFGDWYLVLSAYNSGAGRIYSGIRRTGSTDFWEMRRRLPRETRNYVPQYIAATLIALNPGRYGFEDVVPYPPLVYDTVSVDDGIDLDLLADCAGADVMALRELNPELVQWCTPPGVKRYVLRIPEGRAQIFRVKYANIPEGAKRDWIVHTVRRGETLGAIATRYGITVDVLKETNRIAPLRRLSVGKQVVIPVPRGSDRFASLVQASARMESARDDSRRSVDKTRVARALARSTHHPSGHPKGSTRILYSVKKGDTIGHIAEWYDCRAADIRNWNDIAYGSHIRVGQTLEIFVKEKNAASYKRIDDMTFAQKEAAMANKADRPAQRATSENTDGYTVKSGETLEAIARDHGVSIVQLKRWNHLRTSRINSGQRLVIHKSAEHLTLVTPNNPNAASHIKSDPKTVVYVVKKGDTLWDIAKAFAVTPSDLMEWNDLGRNKIIAGQELLIRK